MAYSHSARALAAVSAECVPCRFCEAIRPNTTGMLSKRRKTVRGNFFCAAIMVFAYAAPAARGDMVTFTPDGIAPVVTVTAGDTLFVDAALQLSARLVGVNIAVDLLDVSTDLHATTGSLGFAYSSVFSGATIPSGSQFIAQFVPPLPLPAYRVDNIGGFFDSAHFIDPATFPSPLGFSVGAFSISTNGMDPGSYELRIDSSSQGQTENLFVPLSGSFPFTVVAAGVVPVPGAFLLGALGLGCAGVMKRRLGGTV